MEMLFYAYLFIFSLGLIYGLIAGILGGILGGHDGTAIGGDISADVSGDVSGAAHFSPFSPMVLSTFLVTFGASGIVCYYMMPQTPLFSLVSIAVSSATSFAVAYTIYKLMSKLFRVTQGDSQPKITDIIGIKAQVIIPIPVDGVGKIQYTSRGTMFTGTASSENKKPIANHAEVIITRVVGNTYFVKESIDEKLHDLG
jgi:membrane protein implicated in regulation of membrane protease activity